MEQPSAKVLCSGWLSRCLASPASLHSPLKSFRSPTLSPRLVSPAPPLAQGTESPCTEELDPYGAHLTSICSKDGSLHGTHSAVLATTAQTGRHFGYKVELEVSHYLQESDSGSHRRSSTKTTSWPEGEVVMDLAVYSPVPACGE